MENTTRTVVETVNRCTYQTPYSGNKMKNGENIPKDFKIKFL